MYFAQLVDKIMSRTDKGKILLKKECTSCKKVKEKSVENFKYNSNKAILNEDRFKDTCRDCDYNKLLKLNWKEDKLRCFTCSNYFDKSKFSSSKYYSYREFKDKRCANCKRDSIRKYVKLKYKLTGNELKEAVILDRINSAKSRSKDKGFDMEIDIEYIKNLLEEQNGKCSLSNMIMTFSLGKGRSRTNISIDRINNNYGYAKNNVQLICSFANIAKNSMTNNQFIEYCHAISDNNRPIAR